MQANLNDLLDLRRALNRQLAEHDHSQQQVAQEREALRAARQLAEDCAQAQQLVQGIAEAVQQRAHAQIAAVVTRCLKAVFGSQAYEFKIDFVQARGKTEAHLKLERDGLVMDDPLNEAGGGIIDVASFALRVACLLLSLPRKRRLLCLDEPMKMLSKNHAPAVGELLLTLAEELDIQIILVTHNQDLMIGKVVELT